MAGRPNFLDTPGNVEAVAMAWVDGKTRPEMCELFGVSQVSTITRWTQDPRVRAKAKAFAVERILRVVRRTDSAIEKRLQRLDDLSVKEILAIRSEFIHGPGFEDEAAGTTAETVTEITEAIERNPAFAQELDDLLSKAAPESE